MIMTNKAKYTGKRDNLMRTMFIINITLFHFLVNMLSLTIISLISGDNIITIHTIYVQGVSMKTIAI